MLDARARGRCALIPYLTLGYPTLEASLALLASIEEMGVDAVELGVPFSDPVADGPTIQATTDRALAQGVSLRRILETLEAPPEPRARVLFSYFNPLLRYGLERLPAMLRPRGISSVLVTDLVPEEAQEWCEVAERGGIESCFLVASTSPAERMRRVAQLSTGFVYCVATLGVTGSRQALDESARETVSRLRESSDAPVAVGFGLSSAEDVRRVREFADGAIVGSALLRALGDAEEPSEVSDRGREFLSPLLEAAHG